MKPLLKPFTVFFACISLFQVASAQSSSDNSKYIEVTITDSAEISPDRIEYMLELKKEYNYETAAAITEEFNNGTNETTDYVLELKRKEEEEKLKMKSMEKRLIDILEKEKIPFTRKNDQSYMKYMYMNEKDPEMKGFLIVFNSFEQMEKFMDKIPTDIKHNGNVHNISSTNYRVAEAKVVERALKANRTQAENIAKLTNVKLGDVIQFSDNEGDNLVRGLERLMYSIPKLYEKNGLFNNRGKIIIMKTVRVRYAIQ